MMKKRGREAGIELSVPLFRLLQYLGVLILLFCFSLFFAFRDDAFPDSIR